MLKIIYVQQEKHVIFHKLNIYLGMQDFYKTIIFIEIGSQNNTSCK